MKLDHLYFRPIWAVTFVFCALAFSIAGLHAQTDPLPSWNDTSAKKAIIVFVEGVTKEGSPNFVPVPERIAVFDNDGTLWAEQPTYFQGLFLVDRVKALAPQHLEWKTKEPFEWAYDRESHMGKLDKAWNEALTKGWTVVDMKKDWKRIFPFEEAK